MLAELVSLRRFDLRMLVYKGYAVVKRWVKTSSITQALIVKIIENAQTGFKVLVSTVIS